jgi:hypothetical protein
LFFTSSKPGSKFRGSGMGGRWQKPAGGPVESVGVASVVQRGPEGAPMSRREVAPLAVAPVPTKPKR